MLTLLLIGAACTTDGLWPTEGWTDDGGARVAARPDALAAFEAYAFTLKGADKDRVGIRTDGVVITQGGRIIYERYGRGHSPEMKHIAWSVSKSFSSAMIGAASLLGVLLPEDSVCAHLPPELQPNCDITIRDVLEFGSGLAWQEIYEDKSNQESSTLALLYGVGRDDRARFVMKNHKSDFAPGEHFDYSTGSTVILTAVLHYALKDMFGEHWPWPLFFDRIGISGTIFERDKRGIYSGGSHVWATPRDFAKFGYLFLRGGCWNGERVLPEDWVARSTALSNVYAISTGDEVGPAQGWQWWINKLPEGRPQPLAWPDVPEDTYSGIGHWGQYVTVVPSLDMVIVRTGDDRDDEFDLGTFVAHAIALGRE